MTAELSYDEVFGSQVKQPRGIRNNNPLNLKANVKWAGATGTDGPFATFSTMDEGLAAADRNLQTYHTKHGINTVSGVVGRWAPPNADGNHTAAYVKHVAGKLGVDPNDALDMVSPETRRALSGAMAEFENGQPLPDAADAAPQHEMSYEEVFGADKPPPGSVRPPQRSAPPPGPTIAQDAASGFVQPFKDLGRDVADNYRRVTQRGAPKSFGEGIRNAAGDFMAGPQLIGDALGLAAAPVQAAVRPAARAINRLPMTPYAAPKPVLKDGKASMAPARALKGDEAQAAVEGGLNAALSGARPGAVRAAPAPRVKPASLDELRVAKDTAYKAVDTSGFTFKQESLQGLAKGILTALEDAGGPELNEQAAKMARRVQSLADRGALSLSQLDKLRGQVGEKVIAKGEPTIGYKIRDQIDALIDGADVPEMRAAREANMRFKKVEDVTNRIEDAKLAKAASGTGSNTNTARQALKPLVQKKSAQRMKNATPAEVAAIKKVVRGGKGENVLRLLTAFDPTAGKLRALINTGAAGATHGMSALAMPVGMAASAGEKALQAKNIQALIDLMSKGGVKPAASKGRSLLSPAAPLTGPSRLLGAGVVAAPLARIAGDRAPSKASGRKAQPALHRKPKQRSR